MKPTTINGMSIPQFEPKDFGECMHCPNDNQDDSAQKANEALIEYFKNRVCWDCKFMYFGEYEEQMICNQTAMHFVTANQNPESFSCSAFREKT